MKHTSIFSALVVLQLCRSDFSAADPVPQSWSDAPERICIRYEDVPIDKIVANQAQLTESMVEFPPQARQRCL